MRRFAYLVEIALAVLMAGFGSTVLAAAPFYARTYESYDLASAILTGALLLISAAGFAFAAWSLRGRSRPAWTKHWLALIVALSALAGQIWGLHVERGPTPLSASRGSSPSARLVPHPSTTALCANVHETPREISIPAPSYRLAIRSSVTLRRRG